MKKLSITLFILLSISTQCLFAQTQAEMTQIAMNDYDKSDKILNSTYKNLMNLLDDKYKQKLISTQKQWIKFRDSNCQFEASQFEGGTIQPLIKYTCLQTITEQRIENLNQSINSWNH